MPNDHHSPTSMIPEGDGVAKPSPAVVVNSSKGKPRAGSVKIQVLRINLLQLQHIDITAQVFSARYLLQLRIPDGAEDPDMIRDLYDPDPQFPQDTLRPGARWFMEQIEFPTALNFTFHSKKIVKMGRHLDIVLKLSGSFFEHMELENFPLDIQRVSTCLSFACSKEGIVPIDFDPKSLQTAACAVGMDTFALSNMWHLSTSMHLQSATVNPMPKCTYPAILFSALIMRKPMYFIANAVFPLCSLTFLALLQFLLPGERESSAVTTRITYSITILLTSATYKLFVSDHLPAISYLSVLDRYAMACYALQVAMVAQGAVLGAFVERADGLSWPTDTADAYCGLVFLLLFCFVHIYFPIKAFATRRALIFKEREFFDVKKRDGSGVFQMYHHVARHQSIVSSSNRSLMQIGQQTV